MSRVIRIDNEVWNWLRKQGKPLTDTPNSILRRIAGLSPRKKFHPEQPKRKMRI